MHGGPHEGGAEEEEEGAAEAEQSHEEQIRSFEQTCHCLLYTSDAADE